MSILENLSLILGAMAIAGGCATICAFVASEIKYQLKRRRNTKRTTQLGK